MSWLPSTERVARKSGLLAMVAYAQAKHSQGARTAMPKRGHRCRPDRRRTGPSVMALIALAILAAACSSNRDAARSTSTTTSRSALSSTVPSIRTTPPPASTSVPSPTTTTAPSTGAPIQPPSARTANEYAACMRTHGVTDFPNPPATGSPPQTISPQSLDPNSPTFRSAEQACAESAPTGGGVAP
jgi:hypothetical protein